MSRASTVPPILPILVVLVLVLAGAWWIGSEPGPATEVEPVTQLDALVDESATDFEMDFALTEMSDAAELESVDHVAFREPAITDAAPTAAASAIERAGALIALGTLVDAATGEALRGYRFELTDSGRKSDIVTTDAAGAFETSDRLLPGEIRARFFEASRDFVVVGDLRASADGSALPLDLRVAAGPTYSVELRPADAPPLAEHSIWLILEDNRGRLRGLVDGTDPLSVRFAPFPAGTDFRGRAQIVVESRDGVWRGSRAVQSGIGRQTRGVVIELEALAALEVRVVDPEGAALGNAVVTWTGPGGGRPRAATTRTDGITVFERIPAEMGTLRVRLVRWIDLEVPFVLAQGVRRVEIVTLSPEPSAGAIRGTVVSDSGVYERDVRMRLVPLDSRRGMRSLETRVRWTTTSGARVGMFAFDGLPAGRFRLEVVEDDFYTWEERRIVLETPREDVLFVVKDTVAVVDLAFEPREEDGTPLTGSFEVRFEAWGETRVVRGRDGLLVLAQIPVGTPSRWRIDAAGRAASFGAWPELAPLPSVAGRERRGAAPILARGWAQLYRVVRSDDRRPLANAVAVVDGRETGRTDAQGRIVLRADSRPQKVLFRWKDWRMVDRIELAPLRAGSPDFERTLRMAAPKKSGQK